MTGTANRSMVLWADSLARRITAMHSLWQIGVDDLTLDQVNHFERSGVLPIAFSLLHFVRSEDNATSRYLLKEPSLWDTGEWATKIGPTVEDVGRGTPMPVAEQLRFRNVDAWKAYQAAVFDRTETAFAALPPDRFAETPLGDALPETMAGAFISYAVPPGRAPTLLDVIECFVYQHGIRHLGELEHARALVGLSGAS
ncbi:hypothetical protein BH23CHL2_BH23CHL2_10580 [soil metagenome]